MKEIIIRHTPVMRRYSNPDKVSEKNTVRAYRDSPESVQLQMRMNGSYVGLSLTFKEAVELANALKEYTE